MNEETKPRVLIVYFTLTKQVGRVAEAMAQAVRGAWLRRHEGADRVHRRAMGAEALAVSDEAPDPPDRDRSSRRSSATRRGEIRIPPEAQAGDYDLVVLASPDLVVPDEHADPLVPRVARGEDAC